MLRTKLHRPPITKYHVYTAIESIFPGVLQQTGTYVHATKLPPIGEVKPIGSYE